MKRIKMLRSVEHLGQVLRGDADYFLADASADHLIRDGSGELLEVIAPEVSSAAPPIETAEEKSEETSPSQSAAPDADKPRLRKPR